MSCNNTQNPVLKAVYEAQVKAAKDATEAAKVERDKQISDATAAIIKEGDAYQQLTDRKLKLSKELTKKLLAEIKRQVEAEIAAGKITAEEGQKIIKLVSDTAEKSKKIDFRDIADLADELANNLERLADVSGDSAFGDFARNMSGMLRLVSEIGTAFAQGGIWGAIAAAAKELAAAVTESFATEIEEERELRQNRLDFLNEYNNMLLEVDTTSRSLFGDTGIAITADAWDKATRALQEYQRYISATTLLDEKATNKKLKRYSDRNQYSKFEELYTRYNALKKGYTDLQSMSVKTKDRSGFANWLGYSDKYTSLKDLAPNLWDSKGDLNVDAAKAFLATNTQITEEQRKQIQQAVDLKEAYDDAMIVIDNAITDTFNGLSRSITDAIFEGVESGADAFQTFKEIGSEVIHELGKQLVQELYVQTYLDQYRDKLRAAYGIADAEKRQQAIAEITKDIFDGLGNVYQTSYDAAVEWNKQAEEYGYGYKPEEKEDKDKAAGIKGDVAKMTEDTGTALVGQLVAMRLNVAAVLANGKSSLDLVSKVLAVLEDIRDNTAFCRKLERIDETLIYFKNNGMKMN